MTYEGMGVQIDIVVVCAPLKPMVPLRSVSCQVPDDKPSSDDPVGMTHKNVHEHFYGVEVKSYIIVCDEHPNCYSHADASVNALDQLPERHNRRPILSAIVAPTITRKWCSPFTSAACNSVTEIDPERSTSTAENHCHSCGSAPAGGPCPP